MSTQKNVSTLNRIYKFIKNIIKTKKNHILLLANLYNNYHHYIIVMKYKYNYV